LIFVTSVFGWGACGGLRIMIHDATM
jgi:hypothetical protein